MEDSDDAEEDSDDSDDIDEVSIPESDAVLAGTDALSTAQQAGRSRESVRVLEWEIGGKKKNKHVYIPRDVRWFNEVSGAAAAAVAIAVQTVIMREIEDECEMGVLVKLTSRVQRR